MNLSTSTNIYFNRPNNTKATIEQSIMRCAKAGYKVMDMNFHDCTTFKLPLVTSDYKIWIENVLKTAIQSGVSFSQCHLPFYNFCQSNFEHKEYMDVIIHRAIDCAAFLQIPYAVIHAGTALNTSQVRKDSLLQNKEYFSPLIEYAQKQNVNIVFENLWDYNITPNRRYTTEVEDLMELVTSFNNEKVGVCYDTDHATLMNQNHKNNLMCMKDRLVATHISDCINIDSDHLLPFFGMTNWHEIMQGLKGIDYKGDFTYEIHRYTQNMPDEIVDEALKYSVTTGTYLLNL